MQYSQMGNQITIIKYVPTWKKLTPYSSLPNALRDTPHILRLKLNNVFEIALLFVNYLQFVIMYTIKYHKFTHDVRLKRVYLNKFVLYTMYS